MGERRTLRSRLAGPARELAKFGTVGAVGFLVNFAVFNLCVHALDLAVVRSGVIATFVAICTNYVGNRYWTYRESDRSQRTREVSLFFLFSGIGLLIENGVLAVSYYGFGFTSTVASNIAKNVIGLGLGTAFRFWSYRTWVFQALPAPATAGAAAPYPPEGALLTDRGNRAGRPRR
jgi:putative flippase GtrA